MSILIKGMEMPQNCGECLFKHLSPTGESLVCDISLSSAPTIIPAEPSEEQREYEAQVEAAQYCEMYEPSYDPETGAL